MKNVDYNWLDEAWKTAINTRHVLNVSGGTEKVRYFIGGAYMYSDGNFQIWMWTVLVRAWGWM